MPRGKPVAPLIERFMAKVNKDGSIITEELGKCWLWTGGKTSGYGQLVPHVWGEQLAHRWSYKFHNGEIPEGKMIRHKCDTRLCVNPAHLEVGDALDNVHDMVERNEKAFGRKISNTQVIEICQLRKDGLLYKDIAETFGMSRRTIEKICLGKRSFTDIVVKNPNLISDETCESIRNSYKTGSITYCELSEIYGISQSTISSIINFKGRFAIKPSGGAGDA